MELIEEVKIDKIYALNFKVTLHFEDVSIALSTEDEIPVCQTSIGFDIPDDVVDPLLVKPM